MRGARTIVDASLRVGYDSGSLVCCEASAASHLVAEQRGALHDDRADGGGLAHAEAGDGGSSDAGKLSDAVEHVASMGAAMGGAG